MSQTAAMLLRWIEEDSAICHTKEYLDYYAIYQSPIRVVARMIIAGTYEV